MTKLDKLGYKYYCRYDLDCVGFGETAETIVEKHNGKKRCGMMPRRDGSGDYYRGTYFVYLFNSKEDYENAKAEIEANKWLKGICKINELYKF